MELVNRKVCRGRGNKGAKELSHISFSPVYNKIQDHELSNCDTQVKFKINNGLSEENREIIPLSKAKRVIFDRCSFLWRAGKVANQLNIM